MTAPDVAELVAFLEENGLEIYLDGGWAVDAVLGEQTRPHDDLDIAMPHAQVPVRCVPPDWLLKFHTGYAVDEKDWRDVRRLCERFNVAIPAAFSKFR